MSRYTNAQVVNKHLTALAQGFSGGGECIADKLMTPILTDKAEFSYINYSKASFQPGNSERALTAPVVYNDHGYEILTGKMGPGFSRGFLVDTREDKQTNGVPNLSLAAQKLKIEKALAAREAEIKAAAIISNVASYAAGNHGDVTNAGSDGWNDPDTDIYGDIITGQNAVEDALGVTPNKLLITNDVLAAMRKNNVLKAFFANTVPGASAFTLDQLAKILGVDEIIVGKATYTAADGTTTTKVWGTELATLIYVPSELGSGIFDPSALPAAFGYKLQMNGMPFVEQDYIKARTSDAYVIHDNYLHLQTSNSAGYFFESVLT